VPTELETLQNDVKTLAGCMQTLAKAILVKDFPGMEEEAPAPLPGMGPEGAAADCPPADGAPPMPGKPPMPGPGNPADDELAMAFKTLEAAMRSYSMGFAHAARVRTDEHDAPWNEKDSNTPGNEPAPAGKQGGNREDETFGPGGNALRDSANGVYKAMTTQMLALSKRLDAFNGGGTVIAKELVPALVTGERAGDTGSPVMTRDMEAQFRSLPWKEINKFRLQVGDLKPLF
jgi:hypothetical protein